MAKDRVSARTELYLPNTALLSSTATARAMGFESTSALSRARLEGRLPITMFQVPGRRGWFAATSEVRSWLELILPTSRRSPTDALPARETTDA